MTNSFDGDLTGLDFKRGLGFGTGLELVRALVPTTGVDLDILAQEQQVVARLDVAPPIVQRAQDSKGPLILDGVKQ